MKILIPTAKELNLDLRKEASEPLSPLSQTVLETLSTYRIADLEKLYKVSFERASNEYQRIQLIKSGKAPTFPAISLFDGLMYRHIKRDQLSLMEETYLRERVLIASSLYGLIPAYTRISPYRLDFMTSLKVDGKSLKAYWKRAYDQVVAKEEVLLSLLSSEFETVFSKDVRNRMFTFKFMENHAGKLKTHSTISKKARGDFLSALIMNQIEEVEDIKKLEFAGFSYQKDRSSSQEFTFIKDV